MDETETLTIHYTNHKFMKRNQPMKRRFTSPVTIFGLASNAKHVVWERWGGWGENISISNNKRNDSVL